MSVESWKNAAKEEVEDLFEYAINDANSSILADWIIISQYSEMEETKIKNASTMDDIEGKLSSSKDYTARYEDTDDKDYLQMAYDETVHALKFITMLPDGELKNRLIAEHDKITDRLREHSMAL